LGNQRSPVALDFGEGQETAIGPLEGKVEKRIQDNLATTNFDKHHDVTTPCASDQHLPDPNVIACPLQCASAYMHEAPTMARGLLKLCVRGSQQVWNEVPRLHDPAQPGADKLVHECHDRQDVVLASTLGAALNAGPVHDSVNKCVLAGSHDPRDRSKPEHEGSENSSNLTPSA
jgi:hypothetical protein